MLKNIDLFNECLQNRVPNIDRIARAALNRTVIPVEKKYIVNYWLKIMN